MSSELIKARQHLSQVRSYLRQEKMLPAIQALHSAIILILKNPLMKSEREEFAVMLDDAVYVIMSDTQVKQHYPLEIAYTPGNERQLLDDVRQLLETIDSTIRDAAQEALRQLEERRKSTLIQAEALLEENNLPKATALLTALGNDFKDDSALFGQIGELFLKYGAYDEAIIYLETALTMNPDLAHLYNKIGMALRKIKNFATAERYYLKASKYLGKDPNLFFNLGRLYLDWEKWDKAILATAGALKLQPDFMEAKKLQDYAQAKQNKQQAEKEAAK